MEDYERFKLADLKKSNDSNKSNHKKFNKDHSGSKQKSEQRELRCYLCGDTHTAKDCPTKEKGAKCFRCNVFGHKSSDKMCKDSDIEKKAKDEKKVTCLNSKAGSIKNVLIRDTKLQALIDTGRNINAIRRSLFKKLDKRSKYGPIENFKAAGGAILTVNEYFVEQVKIDDDIFETTFFVGGENDIPTEVVIGNELLFNEEVEMMVKNGHMLIKRNECPSEK